MILTVCVCARNVTGQRQLGRSDQASRSGEESKLRRGNQAFVCDTCKQHGARDLETGEWRNFEDSKDGILDQIAGVWKFWACQETPPS